ncbi:hypothetical protein ACQI5H_02135 [Mycobacterium heidelbergense]|uniref:hypothetical protein n=1 Tax=Mycobacterium heidelbergense TaxID=53376 RepID=UPI003CF4C827
MLIDDEDIEDVGALSIAQVPGWVRQLGIPEGWQLVQLYEIPRVPLARMAVLGPREDGGWEAAETISVFGYTGWPVFYEVLSNAAGTLRDLGATDIVTKVLPIPPTRWAAALRSSGTCLIGGRRVWVQQSNYVAGSEQPRAGRLIVHSVFVDAASRGRLAEDISQMGDAVYQGFVAALRAPDRAR